VNRLWWWGKILLIFCGSVFFLFFGVGNLLNAYKVSNPLEFIVLFFSSSLMILISVTGVIYVIFQLLSLRKTPE
jgi:hypothetical protein